MSARFSRSSIPAIREPAPRPREQVASGEIRSSPKRILHIPIASAILLFCLICRIGAAVEVPIASCFADAFDCENQPGAPYHGPTPPDVPISALLAAMRYTAGHAIYGCACDGRPCSALSSEWLVSPPNSGSRNNGEIGYTAVDYSN
jgi:hypothetical protein